MGESKRCKKPSCCFRNHEPGAEILKIVYNPATLQECAIGPFVIQQVHLNGTLIILGANDIYERINIGHVYPYCR
jgi:hypothetical protein